MYNTNYGLTQRRRQKQQQKEIENRICFRRNLKSLEAGEKNLTMAAETQRRNAVEAEKKGDHAGAIRFALEAQRLEKQARVTGDMKNTTLTVHAISENTRALSGMMKSVNHMAGSGIPDAADMIGMQMQMESIRENMDMIMETSGEVLDQLTETEGQPEQEAGEAFLRDLLKQEESRKHRSILAETGKKLDALFRIRVAE